MKKNRIILFASIAAFIFLSSCIKQLDKTFMGNAVVEIDAAVLNSAATGVTYPIISRIPLDGIPIANADSTARRISGTLRLRVNLVGAQRTTDETIGYRTFASPITTFAFPATATGQTPTAAAATLNVSDAIAGTHYTTLSGKITIPKNSSFGYLVIPLLSGTPAAGQARFIGIRLDSTGTLLPALNYRDLGVVIDQR